MKVVAFSFNGVQPIDSNKEFVSEVLAAAPGKKFIVMCEAGGTMRGSVNFPMVGCGVKCVRMPCHAKQMLYADTWCSLTLTCNGGVEQSAARLCPAAPGAACSSRSVQLSQESPPPCAFLSHRASRSLQAAFKLIDKAGLTADDVVHQCLVPPPLASVRCVLTLVSESVLPLSPFSMPVNCH